MSGFLGGILGSSAGGVMESAIAGALPGILMQMMSGSSGAAAGQAGATAGGLAGLVQQLEGAGLGQQVQSWIGSGQNQPVSPQQLGQAFPPQQVQQWAQQAGTSSDSILATLAHVLPHAVDQATPNGQVPGAQASMPDFGSLIGRLLGR